MGITPYYGVIPISIMSHIFVGTKVAIELEKIIDNKRLLADIKKLSHGQQTSYVEAFHSLLIRFAPKMHVFSFTGMMCR